MMKWDRSQENSGVLRDLRVTRCGFFDFGFWISDCGFRGKAQSAESKALEFSDLSDLSAFTLCAMR